jgi:hypothetical protein
MQLLFFYSNNGYANAPLCKGHTYFACPTPSNFYVHYFTEEIRNVDLHILSFPTYDGTFLSKHWQYVVQYSVSILGTDVDLFLHTISFGLSYK